MARERRVLGTALREILQRQGINVCSSPFGKQLGEGLFGFRLREDSLLLRVFCHAYGNQIVLLLSGLSFLGLGIQPPQADWGSLVRENIIGLSQGAPAVIVPAIAIATLTIGVNMAIDSLVGRKRRGSEG